MEMSKMKTTCGNLNLAAKNNGYFYNCLSIKYVDKAANCWIIMATFTMPNEINSHCSFSLA